MDAPAPWSAGEEHGATDGARRWRCEVCSALFGDAEAASFDYGCPQCWDDDAGTTARLVPEDAGTPGGRSVVLKAASGRLVLVGGGVASPGAVQRFAGGP